MPDRTSVFAAAVMVMAGLEAGCAPSRQLPPPPERVMVGYGVVGEHDLTGAVSSVSGDALYEGRGFTRVEEMIRDRVPGVDVRRLPDGDYALRVRGTRSLIGSNEPLLVVDGMPVSPSVMRMALATINPGEVIRIDVLKDAGSTAAYGSRGANGVILITTRASVR